METAVYVIENTVNNKKYIGSTKCLARRWYIHKHLLKKNTHINVYLQNAWNKYGENCFNFYVLEKNIPVEELPQKEKEYIEKFNCLDRNYGYNIAKDTIAPMLGRKHSEESIKKMVDAKIGEKNNFFGKHHTQETKNKISIKKKGWRMSDEHKKIVKKKILGEKNQNAKMTYEKVKELRELHEQLKNNGPTTRFLSEKYGISDSTVRRIILKITWKEEEINEIIE